MTYLEIVEYLTHQFTTNQFLIGATFTTLLIGIVALAKNKIFWLIGLTKTYVTNRIMVSIILPGLDELYPHFLSWMAEQPMLNRVGTLQIISNSDSDSSSGKCSDSYSVKNNASVIANKYTFDVSSGSSNRMIKICMLPFSGYYIIKYCGKFFIIHRDIKSPFSKGGEAPISGSSGISAAVSNVSDFSKMMEQISITTFRSNMHLMGKLFEELSLRVKKSYQTVSRIYTFSSWGDWNSTIAKSKRDLSTIFLKSGQLDYLKSDIETFLRSEKWYIQHGIPYHRGYLLYGPPGTGKSSTIAALVASFGVDIYVLNASKMTDENFMKAVSNISNNSVLLLEDVDRIGFVKNADSPTTLSFSTILNTLDGVASKHGLIVFMTTNNIDSLEKAFIRPGRIDVTMELGYCDEHQVTSLVKALMPDVTDTRLAAYVHDYTTVPSTCAELQGDILKGHSLYTKK